MAKKLIGLFNPRKMTAKEIYEAAMKRMEELEKDKEKPKKDAK